MAGAIGRQRVKFILIDMSMKEIISRYEEKYLAYTHDNNTAAPGVHKMMWDFHHTQPTAHTKRRKIRGSVRLDKSRDSINRTELTNTLPMYR